MSEIANQLLAAFDALPPSDQSAVVAELLRRTVRSESGDVSDDALVVLADSLFLELDADEAGHGKSETR